MKSTPWPAIVGYYLIGLLAAAQLGKMSALAPLIAAELQLPLTTAAAAISLLEAGGATLGVVAGVLAAKLGLRRTLLGGVFCLAAAGLGIGAAGSAFTLLGWRLMEAAGYLAIIVTAPVLIVMRATPGGHTSLALALWSTFVPVGLAVGAWAWAGVAALSNWRWAMAAGGGLALAAALALGWQLRRPGALAAGPSGPPAGTAAVRYGAGRAAWCLAASFGCYALFEVGLLGLLPSFLTSRAGMPVADAGRWTALASMATIFGSLGAAWWLRRGGHFAVPALLALALPAALLPAVFVESPRALWVAGLAVLLNAVSGIYPSLAFALLPQAAGSLQRMVRANGVFSQFGASGSLLGPPVMAWFVDRFGWPAAAWCGVAVSVPSAWLFVQALRLTQRQQGASRAAEA
ncbi:CynX/NimT family MFS transporter [Aquabacterium sp.]|uniref:MFS transporter n=1 Tax=Aquabacterium sp. TaxID=1872578 RepID=UPI003784FEFC